jgi:putative NADH-flavin reductase
MPAKPKILITGATGQVGAFVISYLKADSSVEVIAAARSLEKAKGLGIPSVYLDLDKPESLAPALEGVERAFLATGYTIDMGMRHSPTMKSRRSSRRSSVSTSPTRRGRRKSFMKTFSRQAPSQPT